MDEGGRGGVQGIRGREGRSGAPPVKRGSLGKDKHTMLAEYYGEVWVRRRQGRWHWVGGKGPGHQGQAVVSAPTSC